MQSPIELWELVFDGILRTSNSFKKLDAQYWYLKAKGRLQDAEDCFREEAEVMQLFEEARKFAALALISETKFPTLPEMDDPV